MVDADFVHGLAAASTRSGADIAGGNGRCRIIKSGTVAFTTSTVIRYAGNQILVKRTAEHAHGVFAGADCRIISEIRAVSTFGSFTIIGITDFAPGRVAVAPGTGLIFANGTFRAGFVLALGLAAFALVTLGNAERNAGLGVGRAAVLTVPVTLAGIVTVGGGNVLFAVAAVAGRHRRLARSLDFFFGGKSRAGVAAMPELV